MTSYQPIFVHPDCLLQQKFPKNIPQLQNNRTQKEYNLQIFRFNIFNWISEQRNKNIYPHRAESQVDAKNSREEEEASLGNCQLLQIKIKILRLNLNILLSLVWKLIK